MCYQEVHWSLLVSPTCLYLFRNLSCCVSISGSSSSSSSSSVDIDGDPVLMISSMMV
jgi:hypothetical protein